MKLVPPERSLRSGRDGAAMRGSGVARQPVLLIHGISLASTCWVVNNPDESLAFILADKGAQSIGFYYVYLLYFIYYAF